MKIIQCNDFVIVILKWKIVNHIAAIKRGKINKFKKKSYIQNVSTSNQIVFNIGTFIRIGYYRYNIYILIFGIHHFDWISIPVLLIIFDTKKLMFAFNVNCWKSVHHSFLWNCLHKSLTSYGLRKTWVGIRNPKNVRLVMGILSHQHHLQEVYKFDS